MRGNDGRYVSGLVASGLTGCDELLVLQHQCDNTAAPSYQLSHRCFSNDRWIHDKRTDCKL